MTLTTPPIHGLIDCGESHNPVMHAEYVAHGPVGVINRWVKVARDAGYQRFWLRMIPTVEWEWLRSWVEAFENMVAIRPILYANPTNWNLDNVNMVVRLGLDVVLDESSGLGAVWSHVTWVREALASAGRLFAVEPLIDRADPWAKPYTCVLAANDMPETPPYQVPPDQAPGGCYRWWLQPNDPTWGVPEITRAAQVWYAQQRQSWVRGVVVPVGLASQGITAAIIRSEVPAQ